jgi:hypothetical protein
VEEKNMISGLLWRCPVCKVNDSIVQTHRRFRSDLVSCSKCDSVWELHRVKGDDFRFKAIAGSLTGTEKPLADWYDMMREDFKMEALDPGDLPLEAEEELYLKGHSIGFIVVRADPRFTAAVEKMPPPPEGAEGRAAMMVNLGPVELFLTNKRLFVIHQNEIFGLPLLSVRGVEVLIDKFVIIRHVKRLVEIIALEGESPLKWRAYLDAVLGSIKDELGIKMTMAYD